MSNKILVIHPALAPYRIEFFNEISKLCDLHVLLLRDNLLSQKFNKEEIFKKVKFNYTILPKGFKLLNREVKFGLLQKIRNMELDTIVTHEYSIQTLQMLVYKEFGFLKKVRIVTWTDDNQRMVRNPQSVARNFIRKYCLKKLDAIICLSDLVKKEYIDVLNFRKPIGVAPLVHKEETFRGELEKNIPLSQHLKREYNLDNKHLIFAVGRLSPEKGYDTFLKAISIIPENEREKMRFLFIGDGPQMEELKEISVFLNIDSGVIFLGRKEGDDLFAWYNLVELLVLPSYFEPYGAVVNEALLSGAYVACSNEVGAKVLIREDENGYIFPVGEFHKLAQLIVEHFSKKNLNSYLYNGIRKNRMQTNFKVAVNGWMSVVNE